MNARRPLAAVALAALALALVFQGGLLFGGSLHHFDWLIHWHYYDWIRIGFQEHHTLARFMIDAWHTPNLVANAQSPVLGPLVWLLFWLPTELYVKGLIALYTAIGAAGSFWLARELGARPAVAACATLLFCCSGFFAAHVAVGHHWSLGAYWLPWLFGLLRRAAAGGKGARAAWLGVAGVQALTLLEGQHHPFLWQNGLVVLWAAIEGVRRRDARWLRAWAGATALGLALAAVRVVPVLLEFADYAPQDRIGGLPPGALLHALLARGQGPETSGFGVVFDHGSGWWEYTFYVGVAGGLFVLVGLLGALRREASLLLAGGVAALLCLDTHRLGFDVWEVLQRVPVAASQRCPARLLFLGLFAAIFAAAVGWERILASPRARRLDPRAVNAAFAALALVIAVDLVGAARPWQSAALGPPQASRLHRVPEPLLAPPARGRVEELPSTPNVLRYRVHSDRAGFLAVQLDWARYGEDWQADGRETLGAPSGHLAVPIAAGTSDVTLRYRTPGLAAGLAISLLTGLGVFVAWLRRGHGGALLSSRGR